MPKKLYSRRKMKKIKKNEHNKSEQTLYLVGIALAIFTTWTKFIYTILFFPFWLDNVVYFTFIGLNFLVLQKTASDVFEWLTTDYRSRKKFSTHSKLWLVILVSANLAFYFTLVIGENQPITKYGDLINWPLILYGLVAIAIMAFVIIITENEFQQRVPSDHVKVSRRSVNR